MNLTAQLADMSTAFGRRRWAAVGALVAANLIPIVGVIAWGWSTRELLLLYWAENVVVAFWAMARMITVAGSVGVFTAIFFGVHFGIFTFVHLIFVDVLTAPGGFEASGAFLEPNPLTDISLLALAGLFVSHGISFLLNFILNGEYAVTTVNAEMGKPYPRMIVLHVAIILGGWVITLIGSPVGVLVLLVLLKIALDVTVHLKGHAMRQGTATPPPDPTA